MTGKLTCIVLSIGLSGCAYSYLEEPYSGPIPAPQVVYRIDATRHFEAVPYSRHACAAAKLVYVDSSRNIRSVVASWDGVIDSEYVVDADSKRYLVSPLISPGCESGGGHICDERFRYSDDFGKTWRTSLPPVVGDSPVVFVGDTVYYAGRRANASDLGKGYDAWQEFFEANGNVVPKPLKPPIDTRPHCANAAGG